MQSRFWHSIEKWGRRLAATLFFLLAGAATAQSATYVTTAEVQLRSGPGTNYPAVATIPKDVKVEVVGREGHWLKVESKHGNKPGYIEDRYASVAKAQAAPSKPGNGAFAGAYRTLRETDLREGPGAQYRIAAKLPADITVNVLRSEGEWLRVESKRGNKPGYMNKRDVAKQ